MEAAWRHAFQLLMVLAFTAVLWGVLGIAAALFGVIGLKPVAVALLSPLLLRPVLGVGFAAAVQQTHVRPGMIEGVRTLGLTLLSWLLPVATGLAAAFLLALLFTGLRPLWATQHASGLLLGAATGAIVLINAAYQDGGAAPESRGAVRRWAARLAALLLTPFVALAIAGLGMRVEQYGLSANRVAGLAVAGVLVLYAGGYAWAALGRGRWMRPLETVNLGAAGVAALVMLALLSPLGDPARLSVDDQLARLRSGRTSAARFDFDALRFCSMRFGQAALAGLARSSNADVAARAQAAEQRDAVGETVELPAGRPFARARVHPAGTVLPADFRAYDWSGAGRVGTRYEAAACLVNDSPCDLFVLDLKGDGGTEVVALAPDLADPTMFARAPGARWMRAGGYEGASDPAGVRAAMAAGDVRPVAQPLPDLQVGPQRYRYGASSDYLAALRSAPARR